MKKALFIFPLMLSMLAACSPSVNPAGNSNSGNKTSSFTDKYSKDTAGYVTWYNGADASTFAYYVPEIENGFHHCAVSEPKYYDLLPGTAIELSANGKTVKLLVTDLCPSSENSEHTSKANYFFDLEKTAFTTLAAESVGTLDMTFKTIPYPTSQNIKIQVKDGVNEYWLAFRFYNMRYPLKKVEFSQDGNNWSEANKLSGIENNWYVIPTGNNLLSGAHYFRLTDVHNQIVVTNNLGTFSADGKVDTGVNFA